MKNTPAAVAWGFAWFFFLLGSYYVIRPVRETMGTVIGHDTVPRLFFAVLVTMLIATPIFGFLVSRFRREVVVPSLYRFFSVWLFGFSYALYQYDTPPFWIASLFYVWVSVFNLFVVSMFWSVLADLFSGEQGKRYFGMIAAGGSLGGLISSLVVDLLVQSLGVAVVLLIPLVTLEIALFCFRRLLRSQQPIAPTPSDNEVDLEEQSTLAEQTNLAKQTGTGGSIWQGLISVFRNPYLRNITLMILLAKFCATTVYLEQLRVTSQIENVERRTELFARENAIVQSTTIVLQFAVASFVLNHLGVGLTLAILPLTLLIGLIGLALAPSLLMAFGIQIASRSLSYGLQNPAREVLFTVVAREDKYKAKNVIDTVVFRGGDTIAGQLHHAMKTIAGATGPTWAMVPCAALCATISWLTGKQYQQRRPATEIGSGATIANS